MDAIFKKLAAIAVIAIFGALTATISYGQIDNETEPAAISDLTGIALPSGARRALPGNIPPDITNAYDRIVPADGTVAKGDLELIVWTGAGYRQSDTPGLQSKLVSALRQAGWTYAVESNDDGITVFSLVRKSPEARAFVGYFGATKDAFVLTWMELLKAENRTPAIQEPTRTNGGSVVGKWGTGGTSTLAEKYTDGTTAFRNGRIFEYTFNADGTFAFIGYIASTMYGCTTTLFNDKAGRYTISGNRITLAPTKNFWRKQNSCAPSGNSEQNYKLDRETKPFRIRTNDYGKQEICLADGEGEACYERKN